jgi:hypothetical protein
LQLRELGQDAQAVYEQVRALSAGGGGEGVGSSAGRILGSQAESSKRALFEPREAAAGEGAGSATEEQEALIARARESEKASERASEREHEQEGGYIVLKGAQNLDGKKEIDEDEEEEGIFVCSPKVRRNKPRQRLRY